MSRLVRAERTEDGCRQFIVAGEHGAVELRESPGYYTFHVHSPRWRADLSRHAVCAVSGSQGLPGLAPHGCSILEGDCWAGMISSCGDYDFDAPDVDTVVQWGALERLYVTYLAGGRR